MRGRVVPGDLVGGGGKWHPVPVTRSARWVVIASLLASCTSGTPADAGVDADGIDATLEDAAVLADAGPLCGCTPGLHGSRIFMMSDDAELWTFDPLTLESEFVLGPVCATDATPYSMAVDPRGRAWIEFIETRRLLTIDVNDLAACEDSGYLPTVMELPYFGSSFVQRGACADLYAFSYSGAGLFSEGPGIGRLAVIEGDPPRARILATTDFDGGELAGTGDGRLFAFTGVRPAKLVEYEPSDGSVIETFALDGFSTTNASAFAFFAGDIYFFTERLPTECTACFEANCATAWTACETDADCKDQIACAVERGNVSDTCGGGSSPEMVACLETCSDACLIRPRARVSQVTRLDWDDSDGLGRVLTVEVPELPIRVVGAGTSPCVPTVPF